MAPILKSCYFLEFTGCTLGGTSAVLAVGNQCVLPAALPTVRNMNLQNLAKQTIEQE